MSLELRLQFVKHELAVLLLSLGLDGIEADYVALPTGAVTDDDLLHAQVVGHRLQATLRVSTVRVTSSSARTTSL